MIIDCHGHFTTVPASFRDWRAAQVAAANDPANAPDRKGAWVSDDDIREGVGNGQLRLQQERGGDLTLFSPIAGLMSQPVGKAAKVRGAPQGIVENRQTSSFGLGPGRDGSGRAGWSPSRCAGITRRCATRGSPCG